MKNFKKLLLTGAMLASTSYSAVAQTTCNNLPNPTCVGTAAYCAELLPFTPEQGLGYDNYPLNSETPQNQFRSFARRDMILLIKYATAKTYCKSIGWPGNGGALGLGDMSEANGAIPGTSLGRPGHPAGTHVNGNDMDIAYYQTGTFNNILRPVCPYEINGVDQAHCVGTPTYLDVNRTALFLGILHESPRLRIIGVDGKIGELVNQAMTNLCNQAILTGPACNSGFRRLAYEVTDTGRGWFRHHHHHLHVSLNR